MPGATDEKPALPIVDPTSATGEEIDPSVDRERIKVVSGDGNVYIRDGS